MRKILLLLALTITSAYSQVTLRTDKKKLLDEFKSTETIFILSNIYEEDVYEDLLKDSWKVTPFKVVNIEELDVAKYIGGKYSFAMMDGNIVHTKNSSYLHTFVTVFMFDNEDKVKELEKMKKKSDKKKKEYDLMRENRIPIADFVLFPTDMFIHLGIGSMSKAGGAMYNADSFYNYKPGFLKNYFQKLSALIAAGKPYSLYGEECTPEIKALTKQTLYIPSYIAIKYDPLRMKDSQKDEEEKEDVFEDYKFAYEYIETNELSRKIIAGEEMYYLRYVRENAQKFLQVVNSKTGEIVYKSYHPGFTYRIKQSHIKDISKAIEKGKV